MDLYKIAHSIAFFIMKNSSRPLNSALRKKLLSPKEVQTIYGISPDHLRSISTRELPRFRLGHRTIRFAVEALERYLATKFVR
jgi:hypothetical protein